ncbi:MAG: DUF5615 family PIN-like protein, partial [Armatimonadetes bacterium]|nr:DUF5615 family PIN-like protein [Armatimonadota bacterium]
TSMRVLVKFSAWMSKFLFGSGYAGLGKSDEDVYKAAYKEDRILLTHDRDFLNDRRFPPYRNPGVVILPGGQGDERVLLRSLSWMILVIGQFRNIWKESKIIFHADDKMSVVSRDYKTGAIKRTIYWFQRHGPVLEWVDD